ncbi:MAG: lipid A biosynthesis acyltransferase [Hirschia sp.]|nr:lipid A biosynthesis acyltransferase [Hirschia sp.]MBF19292.1 lipid A biosynthesis acyltransferase [Hirschia sp.]
MTSNWARQDERGSTLGVTFAATLYRVLGRGASLLLLSPGVLYFYLTGRAQRRASMDYLNRMHELGHIPAKPGFWMGYHHFMAFTGAMLDRLGSWLGRFKPTDIDGADGEDFKQAKAAGGALILTAHLGNPDLLRAVATVNRRFRVNVLMDTENAEKYNGVINQLSKSSTVRLVQVTSIDVNVALSLSQAIERGEWVVMAADRRPAHNHGGVVPVSFLGGNVSMPMGPYILGAALKCPVYCLACVRKDKGFKLIFDKLADQMDLPRKSRLEAAGAYAQTYANWLEQAVAQAPLQWFNFFDYWEPAATGDMTQDSEGTTH